MKRDELLRAIHLVIRAGIFTIFLLSQFAGGASVQTAQAATSGTASGTVMDLTSTAITGVSIWVEAENGLQKMVRGACTDPTTGQYTIKGIPFSTPMRIKADGTSTNCQASPYSYEYWQHSLTFAAAKRLTFTSTAPNKTGIDFTLGEAVPSIEYFIFNMDHPNIDELVVRQAIAYGTNRQYLMDRFYLPARGEHGVVPDSYVAPNAWGAATTSTSPAVTAYSFNPSLAQTILTNDGWIVGGDGIRVKDGTTRLSLTFKTTDAQVRQDVGNEFVNEMQAIGIEIIPTYLPAGTFFGAGGPLATGDFDIAMYTTGNCDNSADHTCVPFPMFVTGNSANDSRYSNPLADAAYNNALNSTNDTDRLFYDRQHQQIVMDDLPVLPLYTRTTISITGTVRKLDGTPFTGASIEVDALDNSGNQLGSVCTNPANGYYTLSAIPTITSVAVYATGGTGCNADTRFYGWSYWSNTGDVSNLSEASPVPLSGLTPVATGIDLSLGEAVPSIEYMIFNLDASTNGILSDKVVRQAIAYGTDRLHILDTVWLPGGEYGTVENSYVGDNHWAKAPDGDLHLYPYNPVTAASMLAADGWLPGSDGIRTKGSVRLSLQFKTTTSAVRQSTGNLFQQEMQAIGIEIVPSYYNSGTFFGPGGIVDTRNFDIAEYTTGACRNTLDETCVPFTMYHNGDPSNTAHYNSAAAETAWTNFWACAANDHACRLNWAIQHQVTAMEDLPYLPLFTRLWPITISGNAGVGGATISWMDGTLKQQTATTKGLYSITVPYDWSGTITPSMTSRIFYPANRSYSHLLSSVIGQNYKSKYIATFTSTGSQDGWVLESAPLSKKGGSMDSASTTFTLGDDNQDRQYRGILSFDTSALPNTAIIQSAVIQIEANGVLSGTSPFTALGKLRVDIRKPYFGPSSSLELVDFSALPTAAGVATFNPVPSGSWYSAALNSAGRTNINKAGLTQFRLYFTLRNANLTADNLQFYSGDAATAADRPVITIIYVMP